MKKNYSISFFIMLLSLIIFLTSCGGGVNLPGNEGFDTVTKVEEGCLTSEELDGELRTYYDLLFAGGFITEEEKQAQIEALDDYIDFGVETYSVEYSTIGSRNENSWSGLIAMPTNMGKEFYPKNNIPPPEPHPVPIKYLPIISIQHPTIFDRKFSPSKYKENEPPIPLDGYNKEDIVKYLKEPERIKWCNVNAWLDKGYIVIMADYPGLGNDVDTIHTFCHADSLARSIVDMIQKGIKFIEKNKEKTTTGWNGKLYLAGHSEGGYATMAAGKYIQENQNSLNFSVDGLVAMSGPYDLSGAMRNIFLKEYVGEDAYPELAYLPYIIYGYNEIYKEDKEKTLYHFFDETNEVFKEKEQGVNYGDLFREEITSLDDGEKGDRIKDIFKGLTEPKQIFTEQFMNAVANKESTYTLALKANDLWNTWVPEMPVYLIHSKKDKVIPIENSYNAANHFRENGAYVKTDWIEKWTPGKFEWIKIDANHVYTYMEGYERAPKWVESLTKPVVLNVYATPQEGGDISFGLENWEKISSQEVQIGRRYLLQCRENENYKFDGWFKGNDKVWDETTYLVDIFSETNIEARFSKKPLFYYTLTLESEPKTGGTVSGEGEYAPGDIITVTTAANSDYNFINWTQDGEIIKTSETFDYIMPYKDVTLTANFEKSLQEDIILSGDFGITTAKYEDDSNWDTIVTDLFGTAYRVADWNDLKAYHHNGGDLLALFDGLDLTEYRDHAFVKRNGEKKYSTSYYFVERHEHNLPSGWRAYENIDNYLISLGVWDGSRKIMAIKKETPVPNPKYSLELQKNPSTGGTVSGEGKYEAGENVSISATANNGYHFVNWTRNGDVISTKANDTYKMPVNNVTLIANFEEEEEKELHDARFYIKNMSGYDIHEDARDDIEVYLRGNSLHIEVCQEVDDQKVTCLFSGIEAGEYTYEIYRARAPHEEVFEKEFWATGIVQVDEDETFTVIRQYPGILEGYPNSSSELVAGEPFTPFVRVINDHSQDMMVKAKFFIGHFINSKVSSDEVLVPSNSRITLYANNSVTMDSSDFMIVQLMSDLEHQFFYGSGWKVVDTLTDTRLTVE